MFSGEDLQKGDRIKMQQMQMRDWTEQQKAEKAAKNTGCGRSEIIFQLHEGKSKDYGMRWKKKPKKNATRDIGGTGERKFARPACAAI